MYKVIDLFAGAGGLSLGFLQTHKYDIKAAFENNPCMQDTYRLNHPNVEVQGDVCNADYHEIMKKYGTIDVVIGGPPCQGFSNANRQKNHAVSQNNMLVKQYLRAVLELQPKAFVMENVSMLRSEVHRFYMEKKDLPIIEKCHIPVKETPLLLLEKNYIFDGALDIIQDPEKIRHNLWSEEDYFELNVIFKYSKNIPKMKNALEKHKKNLMKAASNHAKSEPGNYISEEASRAFSAIENYYSEKIPIESICEFIEPSIMIQRMLSKALEIFENDIVVDLYRDDYDIYADIRSFAIYDYLKGILESPENNYTLQSSVLCAADYGAPQKRMRFVVLGVKKDISSEVELPKGTFEENEYRTVRDAIEDLEDVDPVYSLKEDAEGTPLSEKNDLGTLAKSLRDTNCLKNHIITQTRPTALERFRALKQGQNFHSLEDSLKTNTYTDVSRTQNTIYLRLNYDEPSGTVLNVRKSMWVHPTLDRAISIREAARLQTFPDSFVFCGSKDKQYQQVGNAVPPILAYAIAEKLDDILKNSLKS